jgi:hypothetical protein
LTKFGLFYHYGASCKKSFQNIYHIHCNRYWRKLAYFVYKMQGTQYNRQNAATQIAGATLLLTVILAIMSLPVLFLLNPRYWNMIWLRVVLYFSGSVVFLGAAFIIKSNSSDQIFELMTGGIFLLTHAVFYYLVTRKKPVKNKYNRYTTR